MTSPDLSPAAAELAARIRVESVTLISDLDHGLVAAHAPLIVDTRGVFQEPRPGIVKA